MTPWHECTEEEIGERTESWRVNASWYGVHLRDSLGMSADEYAVYCLDGLDAAKAMRKATIQ